MTAWTGGFGFNRKPAPAQPVSSGGPRSTEGKLVYAVGDIHGRYDLLKTLLAQIVRDSIDTARGRIPTLVFLGDYVDRGPDSAKVLQALVSLERHGGFAVLLLKGNHEQGLLEFLDEPERGAEWLAYGGAETLASYGVEHAPGKLARQALVRVRNTLMDNLPASHLQLLGDLALKVVIGDYAFVHAGVRPEKPLDSQVEADLLWIRDGFLDAQGPFERVIVHGHTWLDDRPQITASRIGIDTGAYATGVLTAVRLDGDAMQIFQARG